MTWRTLVAIVGIVSGLCGCISTPNTKALITPIGAIGIHSFAPEQKTPDQMAPDQMATARKESERLANLQFQSESQ